MISTFLIAVVLVGYFLLRRKPKNQLQSLPERYIEKQRNNNVITINNEKMQLAHVPYTEMFSISVDSFNRYKTLLQSKTWGQNNLFISFTNFGYIDFTINFIESCRRTGTLSQLVMVCLDQESLKACSEQGVTSILYEASNVSSDWCIYNTQKYTRLMFVKFEIVYILIQMGFNVLYSDTDVIFNSNIVDTMYEYIKRKSDYDVLMQNDDLEGKETNNQLCAGFFYMKSSPHMINMMNPEKYDLRCQHDQDYFNLYIKQHVQVWSLPYMKFVTGGTLLRVGYLDMSWPMLHFNYMGGTTKIEMMKKHGVWYLDTKE